MKNQQGISLRLFARGSVLRNRIQRMKHLKRLNRKTACEGSVIDLCRDTVELPDGRIEEWDFVRHKKGGGACVIPVLPDGRLLLIRQYRPAIDEVIFELPAGAKDSPDEDTAATALRELVEETGYTSESLEKLASIRTAVAYCNEVTDIYLACDLIWAGGQKLDEAEEIDTIPFSMPELLDLIFSGKMQDAKSVIGILAYEAKRHRTGGGA